MTNINDYNLIFYNKNGDRAYSFDLVLELEFGRTKNDIGSVSILLPNTGIYNVTEFDFGSKLEIYRKGNIIPVLWYFKKMFFTQDTIELVFFDHITLLKQRVIAWYEVDGYDYPSHFNLPIHEIMYEVVRINLQEPDDDLSYAPVGMPSSISGMAYTSRIIDFTLVQETFSTTVQEDSFAWKTVLEVLQSLANTASVNGENIWFDFIYTPNPNGVNLGTLVFRLWVGLRNDDRRISYSTDPIVFSPDIGTLDDWQLELDFENYYNQVYALGKELPEVDDGINLVRVVPYPLDYAFSGDTLIESIVTVDGEEVNDEVLESKAKAYLNEGRPIRKLTGDVVQTPNMEFLIHYNYGDKVSAYLNEYLFESEIATYNIIVADTEEIRIPFESIL